MWKLHVTWADYGEHLRDLADSVRKSNKHYKCVVGILRGGYPVAVYLSHALDIPLVPDTDSIECKMSDILFCDDIVDTGVTWEKLQEVGATDIASVFVKKPIPDRLNPTYVAAIVERDAWVVFPYEDDEEK